ncbi:hypothetical protein TNCV_1929321 [Trichonephila clavipes]|nr:hypothetical protein TNCV_1929321 [Trichonephila clavipes]
MIQDGTVNDAVLNVTEAIRNAADSAIPKTLNFHRKLCKTMVEFNLPKAKKRNKGGKGALSPAHNTSPGLDGISYELLPPFERGFTNKSPLPIQPNMEGAGISHSMARIHTDFYSKTWKDPRTLSAIGR